MLNSSHLCATLVQQLFEGFIGKHESANSRKCPFLELKVLNIDV